MRSIHHDSRGGRCQLLHDAGSTLSSLHCADQHSACRLWESFPERCLLLGFSCHRSAASGHHQHLQTVPFHDYVSHEVEAQTQLASEQTVCCSRACQRGDPVRSPRASSNTHSIECETGGPPRAKPCFEPAQILLIQATRSRRSLLHPLELEKPRSLEALQGRCCCYCMPFACEEATDAGAAVDADSCLCSLRRDHD